jgi:hypothetical protein
MTDELNGFYAAYLTGKAGQGFALLVFRDGKIVGAGAFGEQFKGHYTDADNGFLTVRMQVTAPPNLAFVQGGVSGPNGETDTLDFSVPKTFASEDVIRVETRRGPINAKIVKVGGLDE